MALLSGVEALLTPRPAVKPWPRRRAFAQRFWAGRILTLMTNVDRGDVSGRDAPDARRPAEAEQ